METRRPRHAHAKTASASDNLSQLLAVLNTAAGLRMYKAAYRAHMTYKEQRYAELLAGANREVERQRELTRLRVRELKREAAVDGTNDNWHIFDSVSAQFKEAQAMAAVFEQLRKRASDRLAGSMSVDEVRGDDAVRALRDETVSALTALTNFSSAQPHIVEKVVDIVGSFFKNPRLFRTRLLNFMLLGGAGTGKTTLARAIARVLAGVGLFVAGEVVEAGRAELVGQYEGQTVARTRSFLVANLDNGVIFIDEAYAVTPWADGKPEAYGDEAATALLGFMTQYIGLYCICVAGYETPMMRYFLGTNEGLSRRFPYKFALRDMSPDDLIVVFKRKLLEAQGMPVPPGHSDVLDSDAYFDAPAWAYLRHVIDESLQGETLVVDDDDERTRKKYTNVRLFLPKHKFAYALFEHMGGSMTNLAEEAVTVLMSKITYQEVIALQRKHVGLAVLREILHHRVRSIAVSSSDEFFRDLRYIERARVP
jgi:hypothetical protein